MAYETPKIRSVDGNTIVVSHPVIPDQPDTFLTSACLASAVTLTVLDNGVFANGDYIIAGPVGANKTEPLTIGGAVIPGSSLTVGATVFSHPADTPIVKTIWNQVEISGSSTLAGVKTVITTTNIQWDRRETTYTTTTAYAFYFVRFKNSGSTVYSPYSDGIAAAGYAINTVRAVKDEALSLTKDVIGKIVTDDFLNQEIFNCEHEVWSERKRWKWATMFDTILGDTVTGQWSITLPTDIADAESTESIYGVRIGNRPNMTHVTKQEFDRFYVNSKHTTLATAVAILDTTITLTDSTDYADDGSITIQDSSYTYTANDRTTGILTLDAAVSLAADEYDAGTDVWQDTSFGESCYYTVWDGKMYFGSPLSDQYANKNIVMDYYSKPTTIDSDNDTVNIPDFTLYHYYLAWKISLARTSGETSAASQNFMNLYLSRKANLKRIEDTGQRSFFRPRMNSVNYHGNPDVRITVTR